VHEGDYGKRYSGAYVLKITGFTQDRGACTRLRIWQPLKKIGRLGLADVATVECGDDPEERLKETDIVVFGRAAGDNVNRIVKKFKEWKVKIVFDLDDNFFEISPFSPHYQSLGVMPVNRENPDGSVDEIYVDGKRGFDVKKGRKIRGDMIDVIRAADMVTVSTEPLRKEYKRFNDNVVVVPNCLDFTIWDREPIERTDDRIRILYTGASNHVDDFLMVRDALREIQKKYEKVWYTFVGTNWDIFGGGIDYSRAEIYEWLDYAAYPYWLKSICADIGIAPVTETKFNDCRSELKWMEYSALGVPTIASNWGSYSRGIKDGETGLLVKNPDDWEQAISRLVEDATLRKKLSTNAYKEVRKIHNLDFVVDKWMDVFNNVHGGK